MADARDKNGRQSKWDTPAPSSGSATEAAREAARKLNAMLAAKGKLNKNATPPLLPPAPKTTAGTYKDSSSNSEVFTEEVDINDSPRRLLLCKGTVQYEITKYSGASVSTKGQYIPALERESFPGQKPLHLFIQSSSKEKVNLAVRRIHGILNGDDPFSPAPPRQTLNTSYQANQSPGLPSGMHYVQEKIFVGLDNVPPEFKLNEKIIGPGESYFQHITRETGAKVQLRGRGSGFIEPTSGREAFEALYIYISHNSYAGLNAAKKLVENLIQTVTSAYQTFQMPQSSNNYYSSYPGHGTQPPQHPRMYMPPVQRYGGHPQHGGASSYPPYPHLSNHYPPRYNLPQQPRPEHHFHPNPQMPPRALYPNQPPFAEGPRPPMNEPHPQHGSPYSTPPRHAAPYNPNYPPIPPREPPQFNNDGKTDQYPASVRHREAERKSRHIEDEKPSDLPKRRFTEAKQIPASPPRHSNSEDESRGSDDAEPSPPPKRRFTEAPFKKPGPAHPPDAAVDKQRSVSSLDQPSTTLSSPSHKPSTADNGFAVPSSVLPVPKAKVAITATKDDASTSGSFKAPLLPARASISAARKNPSSSVSGKKRKLDDSENKSTGFALLGSYDDSSDEDDEDTTKRIGNHRS